MLNEEACGKTPSLMEVAMMSPASKTVITVDADYFPHNPNDLVEKGTRLGVFDGKRVDAPFHARIESISFNADDHTLLLVLGEER